MVHPKFFVLKISEKFVHIRGPFSSHELARMAAQIHTFPVITISFHFDPE